MHQSRQPKKHQGDHSKEVGSLEYPLGMVDPVNQHRFCSFYVVATYLEIKDESWYLLRKTKKVDSSVQERRFKLLFQINLTPILEVFGFSSHVDQKDDMDSELK